MSESSVWYRKVYTGLLFKYAKFGTLIEEEAQRTLALYMAEHNIDIERYDLEVTYHLIPLPRVATNGVVFPEEEPFVSDGL